MEGPPTLPGWWVGWARLPLSRPGFHLPKVDLNSGVVEFPVLRGDLGFTVA